MVKTLLGIALLLCSLAAPAWSLPASDSPGLTTMAQDSAGTVWALPAHGASEGILRRWQSGAWVMQTVSDAAGLRPRILTRGDDGAVYVFWKRPRQWQPSPPPWQRQGPARPLPPQCLVTVQRGVSSRTFARFSGPVIREEGPASVATLYAGREGDVWLADDQRQFRHISRDGSHEEFSTEPGQFFNGGPQDASSLPRIDSLTDGAGRRWFWQGGTQEPWQRNLLRGVLIWDGKALAYHATLLGVPDRRISLIAPMDKDHLWLAVGDDEYSQRSAVHGGLYRLDTHTLSAVPAAPPEPGAFQNVTQIFRANGDWYVMDRRQSSTTSTLWRERNGHWRKCLDKIEMVVGNAAPAPQYPWLAEPSGVWLGMDCGAWWLARNGQPPLFVNWRRGLSAEKPDGLFPLTAGSILNVGRQGATVMAATPQPVRPLPPGVVTGGMEAPPNVGPLIPDLRRHLWGISNTSARSFLLAEWDGNHWRTHPAPKSITGVTDLYACDALGRIWLRTSHWNPPSQPQPVEGRAIYDPARDTWTDYETVQDALGVAASLPGMAFLTHPNAYQVPLFSGDGRVTYALNSANMDVFLYDGQGWRHWVGHEIRQDYDFSNLRDGPHFNTKGHLEIALRGRLCEWTPENGWQQGGLQTPVPDEDAMPPGGPAGLDATPVVDGRGAKWFTWQGAVYTEWHGLWVRQDTLSAAGSPFRVGYKVADVQRDLLGRFFCLTLASNYYDLVVWSPPPVPAPKLSLVPTGDDAVTVRVRTQQHGRHWWLRRLNGGEWSAPQTGDTFRLTTLAHGDYRLEVQVLDDRLQASPSAVAVFSIRVASNIQIARWVHALLGGTEDEREAAVAGLVKQPEAALSALRAVPADISESARWWVEAAIQQVQTQKP